MKNLFKNLFATMAFISLLIFYSPGNAQSAHANADQGLFIETERGIAEPIVPDTVIAATTNLISISGYLETYYSYDLANPDNHVRQPFVYSHNRHNEMQLNLGLVKMTYGNDYSRANLALMTGTYANDNLAAEPGVTKNIFEANAGFKVSRNANLWIDAGIFASHIGFESAISKDCWVLTRSILADNSPYYESGAKISYTTDDGKWFISGLVLNGWQRIYRRGGNNFPAVGHQLTFKPGSTLTLNSSSFIGNDMPEDVRQMRYFHNFYGIFQPTSKFGCTLGFDIGVQESAVEGGESSTWYSPVIIVKLNPTDKFSIAARAEYYSDPDGVIIATGTPNNFQTLGYSVNIDYLIHEKVLWRLEGRGFSSEDEIFILDDEPSTNNFFITTSLAVSF